MDEEKAYYHFLEINKGKMYFKIGRYADAIHHYDQALRLFPGSGDAWLMKSDCLLELGNFSEALACTDKSLEIRVGLCVC